MYISASQTKRVSQPRRYKVQFLKKKVSIRQRRFSYFQKRGEYNRNSDKMLSKTSHSLDFKQTIRNFELNKVTNLIKKLDFCDRPVLGYVINDSGKQVTAYLNTIAYEILKNNALLWSWFSFSDKSKYCQ